MRRAIFIVCLLLCTAAFADEPRFKNVFGPSTSAGGSFGGDSVFWDVSLNYIRHVGSAWWITGYVSREQNQTEDDSGAEQRENVYVLGFNVSRSAGERWQFGGGLSKNVYSDANTNNQNPDRDYKRVGWDDAWSAEATAEYLLWQSGRHVFTATGGLNYDFDDKDLSPSLELFYGWAF